MNNSGKVGSASDLGLTHGNHSTIGHFRSTTPDGSFRYGTRREE